MSCTFTHSLIQVLSPRTAENLKKLYTALYCTTSYKEDYKNYFVHKENRRLSLLSLNPETKTGLLTGSHSCGSLKNKTSTARSTDSEGEWNGNGGNSNETCDDSGNNAAEDETEADTGAVVEVMASTSTLLDEDASPTEEEEDSRNENTDDANRLPELPVQFRKVCPKYTRLRSSTWPVRVPTYFFRRHQLLPSSIAVLPKGFKMKLEADEREGDRPNSSGSATSGEDVAADDETRKIPAIQNSGQTNYLVASGKNSLKTCKAGGEYTHTFQLPSVKEMDLSSHCYGRSGAKPELQPHRCHKEGTAPLSCLLTPSGSRIPHRLGLRFKAQAHARSAKMLGFAESLQQKVHAVCSIQFIRTL